MIIEKVDIGLLKENPNNPRTIKNDKFKKLVKSIKDFPEMLEARPIVVDDDMIVLGGNMRLKACKDAGLKEVDIIRFVNLSEDKKKEFIVKDNVGYGEWDWDILNNDDNWNKDLLEEWGLDIKETQYRTKEDIKSTLKERFVINPFSVIDTRKGEWLNRKKIWNDLLEERGESRDNLIDEGGVITTTGTSLFDPVLAEIMFLWFSPENAKIIDPYAGDIRKGAVAGIMNKFFTGVEIRKEQCDINNRKIIELDLDSKVNYINDSGVNIGDYFDDESVDMIFSCPPYYDLEKYSNLEKDASNQETYSDFIDILDKGFSAAIKKLKKNRFGVVVVGDLRDKNGYYYNFHEDIKFIFNKNGMPLYNEIILIESGSTAGMRVNNAMGNRKIVKMHQNILIFHKPDYDVECDNESVYRKIFVFYKGDNKEIKKEFPSLSYKKNKDINDDIDNEIKNFLNE